MAATTGEEKPNERFEETFKGKTDQIHQQYQQFWAHPSARADVTAYLERTQGHSFPKIYKWVQGSNIFTKPKDIKFGESEEAWLIGNSSSFDVAQYPDHPERAAMSMVHLLAVTKASIFNGVSLDHSNVHIIDEMIQLFKDSWSNPETRRAILEYQRDKIHDRLYAQLQEPSHGEQTEAVRETYKTSLLRYAELESEVHELKSKDFSFGLHLYPDQSIGHLHLHIIAAPWKYRKHSTCEHDKKTKDAVEVRDYIKGLVPDSPTNSCGKPMPELSVLK
ncbi:hypothetical protein BJ170DRAFT_685748 [Xylariales sp. AK1849]|nr:hypothetical protein BJ170DRAFT_685748 [Xylariales sp. AK1849]